MVKLRQSRTSRGRLVLPVPRVWSCITWIQRRTEPKSIMSVGHNGIAATGIDSVKNSGPYARWKQFIRETDRLWKGRSRVETIQAVVGIAMKAKRATGKHKGFWA